MMHPNVLDAANSRDCETEGQMSGALPSDVVFQQARIVTTVAKGMLWILVVT
jgi:hypothetical protein